MRISSCLWTPWASYIFYPSWNLIDFCPKSSEFCWPEICDPTTIRLNPLHLQQLVKYNSSSCGKIPEASEVVKTMKESDWHNSYETGYGVSSLWNLLHTSFDLITMFIRKTDRVEDSILKNHQDHNQDKSFCVSLCLPVAIPPLQEFS